jgi:hypothetical protein
MDKLKREINAILINHLIKEREKVEKICTSPIDRDYKHLYEYITEEISRLNLLLFKGEYNEYEITLKKVLGIEGESNVIS